MMINLLEREVTAAVHKSLGELFAEETLKQFSPNLTKDGLHPTIMAMKRDEVVYRKDRIE